MDRFPIPILIVLGQGRKGVSTRRARSLSELGKSLRQETFLIFLEVTCGLNFSTYQPFSCRDVNLTSTGVTTGKRDKITAPAP